MMTTASLEHSARGSRTRASHANRDGNAQENVLTYAQVARLLGLKLGTVYSLVARKQIPHIRIGRRLVRFSRSELELWLKARAVPPVEELRETDIGATRRGFP